MNCAPLRGGHSLHFVARRRIGMRRLVVTQHDLGNTAGKLRRDCDRDLRQQHEPYHFDCHRPVMNVLKVLSLGLVSIGVRINDRLVHEERRAQRRTNSLEFQRRLLEIETIGKIIRVCVCITQ